MVLAGLVEDAQVPLGFLQVQPYSSSKLPELAGSCSAREDFPGLTLQDPWCHLDQMQCSPLPSGFLSVIGPNPLLCAPWPQVGKISYPENMLNRGALVWLSRGYLWASETTTLWDSQNFPRPLRASWVFFTSLHLPPSCLCEHRLSDLLVHKWSKMVASAPSGFSATAT